MSENERGSIYASFTTHHIEFPFLGENKKMKMRWRKEGEGKGKEEVEIK